MAWVVEDAFIEDVRELFDIFIEGGYVEAGDESLLDRLHGALLGLTRPMALHQAYNALLELVREGWLIGADPRFHFEPHETLVTPELAKAWQTDV